MNIELCLWIWLSACDHHPDYKFKFFVRAERVWREPTEKDEVWWAAMMAGIFSRENENRQMIN